MQGLKGDKGDKVRNLSPLLIVSHLFCFCWTKWCDMFVIKLSCQADSPWLSECRSAEHWKYWWAGVSDCPLVPENSLYGQGPKLQLFPSLLMLTELMLLYVYCCCRKLLRTCGTNICQYFFLFVSSPCQAHRNIAPRWQWCMFFLQGLSGVPGQPGEPGKAGKRVSKQHQLACGVACLVVVMTARCLV